MSRKRNQLEIIRDVLLSIQQKDGQAKPTHILYKSNLSSDMLKQYLQNLIEKKFITMKKDKKGNKFYSLNEKGFNYIKDYKTIKGFMESYGLE